MVYIFYHPFIRAESIEMERFNPDTYPDKFELMAHCQKVNWVEIVNLTGLVDYKELDVGLRTRIGGLGKGYSNEEIVPIIEQACERENIVLPDQGFLSKLLINPLLEALKGEGHDWIWVGDEHGSERKLSYIDHLLKSDTLQRKTYSLTIISFSLRCIGIVTFPCFVAIRKQWNELCTNVGLKGFFVMMRRRFIGVL